jgi:hypothetical protein
MLADRAIESINDKSDETDVMDSTTSLFDQSSTPPKKFLSKISKSFKNLSWFKNEPDLNGTMIFNKRQSINGDMLEGTPSQQEG